MSETAENTDRELWRAPAEEGSEAYADNVQLTADGQIKLCSGGYCIQGTIKQWHRWFAQVLEHQPVSGEERQIQEAVDRAYANPGKTFEAGRP